MSQTTQKLHLQKDKLTEAADKERIELSKWASSQTFNIKEGADDYEFVNSGELRIKVRPLLEALGLEAKAALLAQIPGPKSAPFLDPDDAYIIPLEILGGQPTVSGEPLREGELVYMKAGKQVWISSKLRLLFLIKPTYATEK